MRRVAALDIGTNTCLLLVAQGPANAPTAILERATITRLGKGVDKSGRLDDAAIERTVKVLAEYGEALRGAGATSIDAVCTSAARDSANGAEFLERATKALGARPRIIDGEEEARLTFEGALTGITTTSAVSVFDIGGGSTEIIHGARGDGASRVLASRSMDVGSVRLTERHVSHDPPTQSELDAIRADVERALAAAPRAPSKEAPSELVGVAGTITTLAAIEQELSMYDPTLVHGSVLTRDSIDRLGRHLATLDVEARRNVIGLDPGRADVIVAGALIALAVLDWAGFDRLRVSDRGVRWGLASLALARP